MYILAIAIQFRYFLGFSKLYERFHAQKVQKKSFFCSFLVIFVLLLNQKRFKVVFMHTSECVLPKPTITMTKNGLTNIFYCFRVKKMQKMVFFCLKTAINQKISSEIFWFLFFWVAHMLLEWKHMVRKNGYFDFL